MASGRAVGQEAAGRLVRLVTAAPLQAVLDRPLMITRLVTTIRPELARLPTAAMAAQDRPQPREISHLPTTEMVQILIKDKQNIRVTTERLLDYLSLCKIFRA